MRRFWFVVVGLVVGVFGVGWSVVQAAEVAPYDSSDTLRCKSVVSEAIGEVRDNLVACYFDPVALDEVPGEYEITGVESGEDISVVEAFVWAEPGHGYSWCATNDAGDGGTLFVGPWNTNAELGRNLEAGQLVYINDSRPGYLDGSCTDYIDPDPSPEGVCYNMDNGAGGTLGSPTDGIRIAVAEAGIVDTPADPTSRCPAGVDPDPGELRGAEWGGEFAEFCGTCGDKWWDEWMATNDAFPENWFPGGGSGVQPTHVCAGITVRYFLDGEDLMADGGGTVDSAVVLPGDEVAIELTYDLELFPGEDPASTLIAARVRPNNVSQWVPIWQQAEQVDDDTWRMDVSNLYSRSHPLGLLELRCADQDGYSYWSYEFGEWSDDPAENRACYALTFQYPEAYEVVEGDVVRIGYRMEAGPFQGGDAGVELLEWWTQDIEPSSVGPIFDQQGDEIGDDTGYTWHIPAGSEGYFDLTIPEVEEAVWTDGIFMTCTDSVGVERLPGTGVVDCGRTALCGIGSEGEQNCYRASGIGLAPASWVPGALKMWVCVVKVLVVPEPGFIGDWADGVRNRVEDTPPFSFGFLAYEVGDTIATQVGDPDGTACFSVAIPVGGVSGDSTACVGDEVEVDGGQRTLMALLMIVPTYLAMLLGGWALVRSRA